MDENDRSVRIPDTTIEVRRLDGALVTTLVTSESGQAFAQLEDGSYYAVETVANPKYQLDSTPVYFEVKDGKCAPVVLTNKMICGILIHKTSSTTGDGIYGVPFILYDSNHNPIAQEESDNEGYVRFEGLSAGRYFLREGDNEGYIPDKQEKTVYVKDGETTIIEWKNTPITGQIQITKYADGVNTITGQTSGVTLKGATYEITWERSGKVVDYITTDARGVAASKPLPLGRYLIREVSAPAYYQVSAETFDVTLEYAGQIIKLAAYNKPAELGVTLTKTGIKEVLAGSKMSYRFTIANTSNVDLQNFYFHDKIPYDVTTASALTTGTYNARLTYRILYKTNYNDYRVLASNLLSTNNYSFGLSGLQLMAGEVVTDIYFDFGTVPSGFQSVTKPTLMVSVNPRTANKYYVTNRADAGGKFGETWQSANASWISNKRPNSNGGYLYDHQSCINASKHVDTMLTIALHKMINRCECVILLNTGNAISRMKKYEDLQRDTTFSPWIYSELICSSLIQQRRPERHSSQGMQGTQNFDAVNESLQIAYEVPTKHLLPLDPKTLSAWKAAYVGNKLHPLDVLYNQFPQIQKNILNG